MNHSDVRICMPIENFYTLIEIGRKQGYTDHNYLLDESQMKIHKFKDETVVFGWDWIKWDREFTDVKFVMEFLEEMEEFGHPYSFVRLGEEKGDDEEIYYRGPDDDDYSCAKIEVIREIYVDIPEEE